MAVQGQGRDLLGLLFLLFPHLFRTWSFNVSNNPKCVSGKKFLTLSFENHCDGWLTLHTSMLNW
jgi:hypothetical protein